MTASALNQVVRDAGTEPNDLIGYILRSLDTDAARTEFLSGLSERIIKLESSETSAPEELNRWIAGWFVSVRLARDPLYFAADDEATKLVASGKIGAGATTADLRARYRR